MLNRVIRDIKTRSATMNVVEDSEVIDAYNSYLFSEFTTDISPFASRVAITYRQIHDDSDCFVPDNTKVKDVDEITAPISSLIYKLSLYTNKNPSSVVSNISLPRSWVGFQLFTVQRESEYFRIGNISRLGSGVVNHVTPFSLTGSDLKDLSNYWCRAEVKDSNQRIVANMVINKAISAATVRNNGFVMSINYVDRELTVQKVTESTETFTVEIQSFRSEYACLVTDDAIYCGKLFIVSKRDLFLEALVYPLLASSPDDDFDVKLQEFMKIISIGAARNLAEVYAASSLQADLMALYKEEKDTFITNQRDKDILRFANRDQDISLMDQSRRMLIYGPGYYGVR